MTVWDWIRNSRRNISRHGWRPGLRGAINELGNGVVRRTGRRLDSLNLPPRTTIWHDSEWDICVVLDALRMDAYYEVAPEYRWLPNDPDTIYSPGSMSEEWYEATFDPGFGVEMNDCGLVTWNAYSKWNVEDEMLCFADHMWQEQWDDARGCIPPGVITDRAIERYHSDLADRMVVHYQQPHAPYRQFADRGVIEPLSHEYVADGDNQGRYTVWDALRCDDITHERAWKAYLDNLRWVLDDIERLLSGVEGEVVLTADHGDLFGEWGLYAHPRGVPLPELIKVPWAQLETTKVPPRDGPSPEMDETKGESGTAEERLKQLGYI